MTNIYKSINSTKHWQTLNFAVASLLWHPQNTDKHHILPLIMPTHTTANFKESNDRIPCLPMPSWCYGDRVYFQWKQLCHFQSQWRSTLKAQRIPMKNQAIFSSKDKSKKLKCHLQQFLFGALRVNCFGANS